VGPRLIHVVPDCTLPARRDSTLKRRQDFFPNAYLEHFDERNTCLLERAVEKLGKIQRLGDNLYGNYLEDQLEHFSNGNRANDINVRMRSIARQLTAEEKTALSEFYGAGMGPGVNSR